MALHWYKDGEVSPHVLCHAHLLYPDKDIIYSESCIEPRGPAHIPVILGSWERAERYAKNIIEDVNHFSSGWIDWNLCLDMSGGPNWAGNHVDSPVIINQERDEFYLQPMFFIMGHFSKFVPPGSVAVPSWVREWSPDQDQGTLRTAAFIHPEGNIVLQLLNIGDEEMEVKVEWGRGTFLHTSIPPRALQTLLLPGGAHEDHGKAKYLSTPDDHCVDNKCN
ncbi:putative glucosylceramidase 3 [Eriocheir sinensis]|uniref:putative glucosylceramidase 3 n=1 Tax=Eriocheir sinensis TaxID=95602 RepID=UPI0021CAD5F2|nr:putative glucosylceramidase 3 [Eriocheir sinensis]